MKYPAFSLAASLIKGRLTKIQEIVDKACTSTEDLTTPEKHSLHAYWSEAQSKFQEFETNLKSSLNDNKNLTADVKSSEIAEFQNDIGDLWIAINCKVNSKAPVPTSSNSDSPVSENKSSLKEITSSVIRLPKLELKHFDGDALSWLSFINLFDSSIHNNASLPSVVKFQYLLSVLSCEPLDLIKSLEISEPNYQVAYDLLKNRYHSPRRLLTLHLNKILDLPTISSHSTKQMRTFLNTFHEHTQTLKSLACNITGDNPLLSASVLQKMDNDLRKRLESYRSANRQEPNDHTLPQVNEIIEFLTEECVQAEEANIHNSYEPKAHQKSSGNFQTKYNKLNPSQRQTNTNVSLVTTPNHKNYSNQRTNPSKGANNWSNTQTSQFPPCFACTQTGHKVYDCPFYKEKTPNERYKVVKENHRCFSCLGNHGIKDCRSRATCFTCQGRHHTSLHVEKGNSQNSNVHKTPLTPPAQNALGPGENTVASYCAQRLKTTPHQTSTVILGTILVKVTAQNGQTQVLRALLDSGSMCDFITERAAQALNSARYQSNVSVLGLSVTPTQTRGAMNLNIETLSGKLIASHHPVHVLSKIAINLPTTQISDVVFSKVKPYVLADPTWHISSPIDMLIGGGLFPHILTHKNYTLGQNMPHVMGTKFGFVVMGSAPCTIPSQPSTNLSVAFLSTTDDDLHNSLQTFWALEDCSSQIKMSNEDQLCEELFIKTHCRDEEGRYVVRLPFKEDTPVLGASRLTAEKRFAALEHKFKVSPNLHTQYAQNIASHISQGHMVKVSQPDPNSPHFYLPHHGVTKEDSSTTKLRIVFDASSKTSTGQSLNDILLTGPKLQTNICDILLHFRMHKIVFACDIRQMYLQIFVHPDHHPFQLVLWRNTPKERLETYALTRVTFGLNASPYLACRTLLQLAEDEGGAYPEASRVLKTQTYVDDIISGAGSIEDSLELQTQLIQLLKKGGFELRKWISNADELLQAVPKEHLECPTFLQASQEPQFSVLGLHWSPQNDCFTYKVNFPETTPTKRSVLSVIAKIYDPCGFLAPTIMLAKCFVQLLWTKGISWDTPLPTELATKWENFLVNAKGISNILIPRAFDVGNSTSVELHAFSDASENGVAAVIYFRCTLSDGKVATQLVMAKTRVAPLKRVTIPRLELCGAHLLAQIVSHCLSIFKEKINFTGIHLWCDSTIVLTWLRTPPYRLKTFVANRVTQAQELVPNHYWRHVPGSQNPADCASRGIHASELQNHPLWWHGPEWLQLSHNEWPSVQFTPLDLDSSDETKKQPLTVLIATPQEEWNLLTKFSSWKTLTSVMAYVLRFIHNARCEARKSGPLSLQELKNASTQVFKCVQATSFSSDIHALQKDGPLSSKLQRLSPYLDSNSVLRVGARLRASRLPSDSKHPVLLPKKHPVTNLLIDHYHRSFLHSGPQQTQALLSRHVWIVSARCIIRSRIFKCITCFKARPKNKTPLMGDLPPSRVTPSRPFLHTGTDYAGPFTVKVAQLRGVKHIKVYICVFICMTTKAVHLEVADDLTTEAFIACLTRFTARRGLCSDLFSDCGSNFVGADRVLQKIVKSLIQSTEARTKLLQFSTPKGIKFHFNPPASPHFGGLWESAVKSAKHHLRRVMGETILTLPQFTTLITQIEAMMNSRPLTPLSSDPEEYDVLTPGHFLIGSPIVAVPEAKLSNTANNRLQHWHLVQALHQRLWKRWQIEYLHSLQQRTKWDKSSENLNVGDLVLIHQNTPPWTWPLARVEKLFPGNDGVVRVVQVKTSQGSYTRAVHKVFPLPRHID